MDTTVAQPVVSPTQVQAAATTEQPLDNIYSRLETERFVDQTVHDLKVWKTQFEKLLQTAPTKADDPRSRSIPVTGNGNIDNWSYADMDTFFKAILADVKSIKAISNSRNTKEARSKLNRDYLEMKDQILRTSTDPAQQKAALDRLAEQYYRFKESNKDSSRVVVGRPVQLDTSGPNSTLYRFILYLMRFYLIQNKMVDAEGRLLNNNTVDQYIAQYFPNLWQGRMKPTILQHLLRYVQEYPRYNPIASNPNIINNFSLTGINPRLPIETSVHSMTFPAGLIPDQDAQAINALMQSAGVSLNEFNPTAVSSKLFKAVNPAGETQDQAKYRRQVTQNNLAPYSAQMEDEYDKTRSITQAARSYPNINRLLYKTALQTGKAGQESLISEFIRTSLIRMRYNDADATNVAHSYTGAIKSMNATKYPKSLGQKPTKEEKKVQLAAIRAKGREDYNTIVNYLSNAMGYRDQQGALIPLTYEKILEVAPDNEVKAKVIDRVNEKFNNLIPVLNQKYEKNILLSDTL